MLFGFRFDTRFLCILRIIRDPAWGLLDISFLFLSMFSYSLVEEENFFISPPGGEITVLLHTSYRQDECAMNAAPLNQLACCHYPVWHQTRPLLFPRVSASHACLRLTTMHPPPPTTSTSSPRNLTRRTKAHCLPVLTNKRREQGRNKRQKEGKMERTGERGVIRGPFCFYSHFRSGLRLYSPAEFGLFFNSVLKCGVLFCFVFGKGNFHENRLWNNIKKRAKLKKTMIQAVVSLQKYPSIWHMFAPH